MITLVFPAAWSSNVLEVVATQPSSKEIHLIVDNLSAHKTKLVDRFLADHPRVSLHYFVITRNRDVVSLPSRPLGALSGSSLVTFSMTTLLMRSPSSASLALCTIWLMIAT